MHVTDIVLIRQFFGEDLPRVAVSYNALNQLEFVGFAPRGVLKAEQGWHIYKLIYNGEAFYTDTVPAKRDKTSIWDNRDSLGYITD